MRGLVKPPRYLLFRLVNTDYYLVDSIFINAHKHSAIKFNILAIVQDAFIEKFSVNFTLWEYYYI